MSLFSLNCNKFIIDCFNVIRNKDYRFVARELSSCTLYSMQKIFKNHFKHVLVNDYILFLKQTNGFCKCLVVPFNTNMDCLVSKDIYSFIDVMKKRGKLYKSDLVIPLFMSDDIVKEFSNSKEFKLKSFCYEFIYDKNAVINMNGHAWKRKRNAINRFKRDYPDSFVRLATMQDYDKILKIREIWKSRKSVKFKVIDNDFFEFEIQFLLSEFGSQFGKVFLCEVDNNVVACCSVSHLCKNTLYTGHNNYLSEYHGVNEYLYREALIQCGYPELFINDGGASIKDPCYTVKMHYNPVDINHIGALYVQ